MNWMEIATCELGEHEIPGAKANKRILEYSKGVGSFDSDEIPWCSAFVNWVLKRAGYQITGRANARSWLEYGLTIGEPEYGDIVVFWRNQPDSVFGHVAFYLCDAGNKLKVLGGNQGNSICAALYPKTRVLGFRRPIKVPTSAQIL
jgi:uncharacterized protein (TIGR02594 family)